MDRDALKVMLKGATTLAERTEAVEVAVRLGMSLREIEEYLDWLDTSRRPRLERCCCGTASLGADH